MKILLVITIVLAICAAIYLMYMYAHLLGIKAVGIDGSQLETMRGGEWVKNLRLAKERAVELGFKLPLTAGTVYIEGVETVYQPYSSVDVIKASLGEFEQVTFGEEITLYVHSSGNLCFLMTSKGGTVTGLVFEK